MPHYANRSAVSSACDAFCSRPGDHLDDRLQASSFLNACYSVRRSWTIGRVNFNAGYCNGSQKVMLDCSQDACCGHAQYKHDWCSGRFCPHHLHTIALYTAGRPQLTTAGTNNAGTLCFFKHVTAHPAQRGQQSGCQRTQVFR